jgi:hypothetical protein
LDRTFNIKRDFTLDIFRFILENYRPENVFQFEITADILHHEIIQFIQAHVPKGLFRFEIGIQTVNQRANLEVSRRQNFDKTRNIIRQLEDKVEMHLDLIVGLALDYWEDIKFSFEEVFRLFAPELQLGFLKFLKGTPVRDKFEQHGFVFDPHPPYQIIESHYLSREELQNIVSLEHALEIYWNKKRAIHTLKYVTAQYSIFDFLMGLGIYFGEHQSYYRYTLADIYQILRAFVAQSYPHDKILCEMITIDYSLHHKVKPKMLWESELDKAEKNRILLQQGLSIQQFRYVLIPISFDFSLFVTENKILPSSSYFIAQYTGNQYPKIISYPSTMDVV